MRLNNLYRLHSFLTDAKAKVINVSKLVVEDVLHKDILLISSSLVYFTLISIVPFLIFIVPLLKAYGAFDGLSNALEVFLINIIGEGPSTSLLNALSTYIGNGIALGVIGVFTFGYSSVSLVNKVKGSIDKVYKVPLAEKKNNFFFSFAKSLVYILVFSFLLVLISLVYSYVYGNVFRSSGFIHSLFVRRVVLDVFVFSLFFLVFTSMPSVYVNPKSSLVGSVFFLVAFRIINLVISIIIKYFFKNKAYVYGSAAFIIGVLLWIYMFWSIVIISVDISYVLQYKPNINANKKCSINQYIQNSLNIMYMIIQGFNAGEGGASLESLSSKLSISNEQVIEICEKLENSKLISSSGNLKKRRYFPYCKISDLKLYYIIKAVEGDYNRTSCNTRIMDELQTIKIDNFSDKTFDDFADY